MVEVTHQLIYFFSVPLCMTKILGVYTQSYSHGHLLGFSKIVSFDVFKVAKTACWHQFLLGFSFPNRSTLAGLLLFVILE